MGLGIGVMRRTGAPADRRLRPGARAAALLAGAAISLAWVSGAQAAANRVALVVGVSHYDKVQALTNPTQDARLVEQTLQKLGFTVKLLTDPSRSDMIEALGAFEEQAKDAEAAIVYFAGHGAMIDGVNYLLPKDASGLNKTVLTGSAVESARLSQSIIGASTVRLVILDACRNNPVASRSVGGHGGLAREASRWSTQVVTLMSASPGEVALDGSGSNSPFAIALSTGLSRPGMTVGELPSYVQTEVERLTEDEQVPDLQGIWADVHWSIDPKGPKGGAGAKEDPAKAKWEREQIFWQTIKDSTDPADFKAYLEAQDRGEMTSTFRKLAQNRLRSLEGVQDGGGAGRGSRASNGAKPAKGGAQAQAQTQSPAPPAPAAAPGADLLVKGRQAFVGGDYKAAFRDWTTAANQGNGAAMYNLGVMSLSGRGAPKDIAGAARWFKASAETGHAGGMVNWGLCRLNGFGTQKDEAGGLEWIRKAADNGSPNAMGMLAEAYYKGRGVPADPRTGAAWLQKAVDAGDGPSIAQLAEAYENGDGVRADAKRAFELYTEAALSGDSDAMVRLGYFYEDGRVVKRDDVQAATWYQRAAEAGDSEGMSSLAVMFENGKGLPQDYARAVQYYRLAANEGDARGYLGLGTLTARGAGVTADPAEAVKLFQAAADHGSVLALRNLAIMYETGQGVARDQRRAIDYYRRAADGGDEDSRSELRRLGVQ
jgi:TPR repeat protein